mmetsp:Transcript_2891/g.6829  ORF Transcript_2891/g.6829 Transcript_2891/m.6829 type:complete len:203 (-) Transcript_2891:205-813(-)
MDTLSSGSQCSRNHAATAWPASCVATARFSAAVITLLGRSRPPTTRSMAASSSFSETWSASWRAAISAPSLQTLAMSAPEKPAVSRANRRAYASMVVPTPSVTSFLPASGALASASAPSTTSLLLLALAVAVVAAVAAAVVAPPAVAAAASAARCASSRASASADSAAARSSSAVALAKRNFFKCTLKISTRERMSGLSIVI